MNVMIFIFYEEDKLYRKLFFDWILRVCYLTKTLSSQENRIRIGRYRLQSPQSSNPVNHFDAKNHLQ